jgi:RimJ/RimL family protein N-acetyltransferase
VRVRRAEVALRLHRRRPIDLAPLSGLRLRTPRLELCLPGRDELIELAQLAERGIHPPETMPFRIPWTDRAGEPGFVEEFVAYHLGLRDRWRPDSWSLLLGVRVEGEPAGAQDVRGEQFARDRRFETGSWLGRAFQGRGLGTEMRHAVLHLGFVGLGAVTAVSGALEGNVASERVSEKLGYVETGATLIEPRGVPVRERTFELSRERWAASVHPPVELTGLEPCLPLFGLAAAGGGPA